MSWRDFKLLRLVWPPTHPIRSFSSNVNLFKFMRSGRREFSLVLKGIWCQLSCSLNSLMRVKENSRLNLAGLSKISSFSLVGYEMITIDSQFDAVLVVLSFLKLSICHVISYSTQLLQLLLNNQLSRSLSCAIIVLFFLPFSLNPRLDGKWHVFLDS